MFILPVILLFVTVCFDNASSECIQSFMTLCDTFEDFKNFKDKESLSAVMIGSQSGTPNMTSVDLMKTLYLHQYPKLTTLMVIRAVNNLNQTQYAFQCSYDDSSLQYVTFYGNIIKVIDSSYFPLFATKKISMVNNQIEKITGWAFKNIQVENLDLSDNLLEVIEYESLPLKPASKVVTIRNNKLTHIEAKSFSSSLESLNLDGNKFRYMQDGVFDDLLNLKELTLSRNSFNAVPKIKHLTKLIIFDISFNLITSVEKEIFQHMDDLRLLDLSNNQIRDIDAGSLITPGKQPQLKISLALNRLKNLPFGNITLEQQTFVLYGNPWDCNTWPSLKKKILGHEDPCDKKFLSNGSVPYCINYRTGGYPFVSMWDQDVDRLHETIREFEKDAECILAPKRQHLLHPVGFGCVA